MMQPEQQDSYWRRSRYRGPTHPVVQAYVRPKLDWIESILPLGGKSVLDVGCGPGLFTHHLQQRAGRVVGTDRSAWMLQRVDFAETVEADAARLPFDDDSFDVCFEANLLHHADDPQAVVREMVRVARSAVVVIEVNRLNPVMFGYSLVNPAERGGLKFSRRYLRRLLRDAGLHIEGVRTTGMISQNQTPGFLVPFLRWFDIDFPFGEYHLVVARVAVSRAGA